MGQHDIRRKGGRKLTWKNRAPAQRFRFFRLSSIHSFELVGCSAPAGPGQQSSDPSSAWCKTRHVRTGNGLSKNPRHTLHTTPTAQRISANVSVHPRVSPSLGRHHLTTSSICSPEIHLITSRLELSFTNKAKRPFLGHILARCVVCYLFGYLKVTKVTNVLEGGSVMSTLKSPGLVHNQSAFGVDMRNLLRARKANGSAEVSCDSEERNVELASMISQISFQSVQEIDHSWRRRRVQLLATNKHASASA